MAIAHPAVAIYQIVLEYGRCILGVRALVDYDKTFALRDNPFSPVIPLGGQGDEFGSMDSLETKALRIHRAAKLENLFVKDAGPFQKYTELFEQTMENRGFSKDQAAMPQTSLTFLIRGPAGSGKTTFANYLASLLPKYKLPQDKLWRTADYRDVEEAERMPSGDLIKAITKYFGTKIDRGNCGGLIFDSLEAADELLTVSTVSALGRERTVIAFLVAKDNSEFGKSVASVQASAEFELNFLNETEAIRFVESRIAEFRNGVTNIPQWLNQPEWALFPFKKAQIAEAVNQGLLGNSPKLRAFPTIRNLGSVLSKVLQGEYQRLQGAADRELRAVKSRDLEKRLINLLEYITKLTDKIAA